MSLVLLLLGGLLLLASPVLGADEATVIATWNVGLLDRTVTDLDHEGFGAAIDADILVLA